MKKFQVYPKKTDVFFIQKISNLSAAVFIYVFCTFDLKPGSTITNLVCNLGTPEYRTEKLTISTNSIQKAMFSQKNAGFGT